jgi:hypothetical protein
MKSFFTLLISTLFLAGNAQVIAGFENFNLLPGSYINNASPDDYFESGSILLPNDFNTEFQVWSGFAISADTNTTTPGFLNQYSAYPGTGAANTTAYAMGYIFDPLVIKLKEKAIGKPMIGMFVANSTYSYLSMRDGDSFAKKFGGELGTDPDYFLLTIKKYSGGAIDDDSLNIFLADYRSPDPHKDYILQDWKYVDLTILGQVDSLILTLRSSDNGIFGMNTPAYVAIDQVSTDNLLAAEALSLDRQQLSISPNPAMDNILLQAPVKGQYTITTLLGHQVWSQPMDPGYHTIHIADLPQGYYIISMDGLHAGRFWKE